VIVPPTGSAAGGGAGAGAAGLGAALPSRKPQEPQNRFEVVFTWLHCGHTTIPPAGAAAGTGAAMGAAGGGAGARDGIIPGDAATATVPARPVAALVAA